MAANSGQDLDYRYNVEGDREVVASLERVSNQLEKVDQDLQKVNKSGRNLTGITRAASGIGGIASGLGAGLRGVGGLLAGTLKTAVGTTKGVAQAGAGAVQAVVGVGKAAANAVTSATTATARATGSLLKGTANVLLTLRRITVAGSLLGAVLGYKIGSSAANAEQSINQLKISLDQAAGSAEGGAEQLKFLQDTASTLGVSLASLGQPYAQFVNAIASSGGSLKNAQSTFLGLTQAGLALGATSEDIGRGLRQLQQIASKNKITQEDISTLSESIPGAQGLIAQALGVTTEALAQMTATGAKAGPLFEKLGGFLQEKFGAAALKAGDDFQSAKDRLANAVLGMKIAISRSGVGDAMKRLVDTVARLINGFSNRGAGVFGVELARLIDLFTSKLERNAGRIAATAKRVYASFVLMTRGQQAYREALVRLNEDGKGSVATPGSGFTTGKYAAAFADMRQYSRLESTIISLRRTGQNLYETLGNGARGALAAFQGFVLGFTKGKGVFASLATASGSLSEKLLNMSRAFLVFAQGDAFVKLGAKARYAFNFITSYGKALFTNTRVVVNDTVRYLYSKLPFTFRQMASAIYGAMQSVFLLIRKLAPIFKPVFDAIGKLIARLTGQAIPGMDQFKTRAEKLASPFLLLSQVINRLASNGKLDEFAKKGQAKMAVYVQNVKDAIKVTGLLFSPTTKENDAKIDKLFPNAGPVLRDFKAAFLFIIGYIKAGYSAIKGFWAAYGDGIKKGYASLMKFLDKLAPYFGVKSGKEVLILLVIFQLIGGFKILFGILSAIGAVLSFAFLIASLTAIYGIITSIASGAVTIEAGFLALAKIGIDAVLSKIFGVPYAIFKFVVGTFKLAIQLVRDFVGILRGAIVAIFNAVRTLSFAPIITAFKEFGAAVAARLAPIMPAIRAIFTSIFRGVPGLFTFIIEAIGTAITFIGALIASSFAAAPAATVAVITAIILAVIGLAYVFRKQIENGLTWLSNFIYKFVAFFLGTTLTNYLAMAVNFLTYPFRAGFALLMDTIESLLTDGFSATLTKIGKKIQGWWNTIKGWLGFSATIDVKPNASGPIQANAKGGLIRGPGTGTSDSILSWLSNNEYVVRAKRAMQFKPILDMINYGSASVGQVMQRLGAMSLPKFATGGMVGAGIMQGVNRMAPALASAGNPSQVDIYLPGARDPLDIPLESPLAGNDLLKRLRRANLGQVRNGPRFLR